MVVEGGVDVQTRVFLTSALFEDEYSAPRSSRFNTGGRTIGNHWIGRGMGHRAGLYGDVKIFDFTGTQTPTTRSSSQ
jgi:hypothetical protein